jgi:hypothetical protein
MTIEMLERFFFWWMLVNVGIYTVTAIAVVVFRDFVCTIQRKLFGLDEAAVLQSAQKYLGTYKLLITVFNFAPWIAILIIR